MHLNGLFMSLVAQDVGSEESSWAGFYPGACSLQGECLPASLLNNVTSGEWCGW